MIGKLLDRFLTLFIKLVPSSVILTIIVWKCMMGKNFNLDPAKNLDLDFFNTLCGSFTIVGFIIAIYQLSDINTRQEDIDEALHRMKKVETIGKISKCRGEIDGFKEHVKNSNFFEVSKDISELKDELHNSKAICQEKEPEISSILHRIYTIQGSVNREILTPNNTIDKDSVLTLFDDIKELFKTIIEFCKN